MKPEVILELVRKASLFDIFIISFFLLPFVASQWIDILHKLDWSKAWGLVVMLVAYIIGIAVMLLGSRRDKQRETARDQILGYLTDKQFTMMSYERIREKINQGYDDAFLSALPVQFPNIFRKAKLKNSRAGLARLVVEDYSSEG
ncbi:MAG: hypothetical protein GY748_13225 [Planctomycetaceae bacterium]|nr:hypothetical protein [Planctomycetaceae bacterium]